MTRFISPKEISDEVTKLVLKANRIKIAVAFWGKSGIDRLGLNCHEHMSTDDIKIVINLMSGAVDPAIVKRISPGLPGDKIKTFDRLHAKIYWSERGAIIGSCNASANGLGSVDSEVSHWSEAGVWLAPDTKAWKDAGDCVDELFKDGQIIDEASLLKAQRIWNWHRLTRPPENTTQLITFSEAILTNNTGQLMDRKFYILLEKDGGRLKLTKALADSSSAANTRD